MHLWATRRSKLFFGLAIVLPLAAASVPAIWHPRHVASSPRISSTSSVPHSVADTQPVASPQPIADWKREVSPTFTAKLAPDNTLVVNLSGSLGPSDEPLVMTYRAKRLRVGEAECDPMDLGGGSRNIPNWA